MLRIQTTDEVEAREILDPAFMEFLYEWWKNSGRKKKIKIAFLENKIYIAIENKFGIFSQWYHPMTKDWKEVEENMNKEIEELKLSEEIILKFIKKFRVKEK